MKKLLFALTKKPLVLSLVLVAALLFLNVGALFLPIRYASFDLSENRIYSLSSETRRYLRSGSDETVIYILDPDGSNPAFLRFLEQYGAFGDKVSVKKIALSEKRNENFLSDFGYEGISVSPYSVLVAGKHRATLLDSSSFFSYVSSLGYQTLTPSDFSYLMETIESETSSSYYESMVTMMASYSLTCSAEELITGAVEYVSVPVIPRGYFLTGHGEDDPESGRVGTVLSYYGFPSETLDLDTVEKIPEDASFLLLNAPTEDLTSAEAELLLSYLRKGGKLLFMSNEKTLSLENLMGVMTEYGMWGDEGTITLPAEEDETDETIFAPAINTDHDVFAELGESDLSLTLANPLRYDSSLRKGLLITPLAKSPETSLWQNTAGAYSVALMAEEPVGEETTEIVWLSGADSFNDTSASSSSLVLPLYASLFLHQSYETALGEIAPTQYDSPSLTVEDNTARGLGFVLVFLLPVSIASLGALLLLRRRRR